MNFELFIANRYLRARRKEAVISIITLISVLGVAAGVMALIISLAINNGFRSTLQRNLLGATAHVNVMAKEAGVGIRDWKVLGDKLGAIPHVTAVAPVLYGQVFVSGPAGSKGVILKGIAPAAELRVSETLRHLKMGSLSRLENADGLPGIILGSRMSEETGMVLNSNVTVISPQGTLTPFGPRPSSKLFRVVGIFESGFYDLDDNWTYASMETVQKSSLFPML